jgi:hypothetical protein
MTPDQINAIFEFVSALFIGINVWRLYKDKRVAGVSLWPTAFFASWGLWNLYFYPALNQWWSFGAGIGIVIVNVLWLGMAVYYGKKKSVPS